MPNHDIIVIGCSAGGISALRTEELLSQKERNAAVLRHVLEDSHIKVLGDEPIEIVPHSEGTREIETTSGN